MGGRVGPAPAGKTIGPVLRVPAENTIGPVLRAPAKVNLGLRLRGRRADGYHLLESLFVPIDLADRIRVAVTAGAGVGLRISGEAGEGIPADDRNLAWRAAAGFLARSGLARRVEIELEKRIPSPGGLGGGSSDAAAVLRALDAEFPGSLTPAALADLALSLGADVPFFLDPRPTLVEGIGERLTPLGGVPSLLLLLAHPGPPLVTAEVYAEADRLAGSSTRREADRQAGSLTLPGADRRAGSLTLPGADPTIRRLLSLRERGVRSRAGCFEDPGWERVLPELLVNDLEPAAIRLCPAVASLRSEMERRGATAVGLSGSGPCLFGFYQERTAAEAAARKLRGEGGTRTWVVETIPSAPMPAG
jgi:4-diphosphocytidyl-2-C-methyl-D-erythritol kinase